MTHDDATDVAEPVGEQHAIGIGAGQDRRLLSELAAETGGLYQAL